MIRILLPLQNQGGAVMNIRPSAAIRQNYNEIAEMCRKTAEPVFLTKNGEGDLVVMDIETYNRREKMRSFVRNCLPSRRTGCMVAKDTLSVKLLR